MPETVRLPGSIELACHVDDRDTLFVETSLHNYVTFEVRKAGIAEDNVLLDEERVRELFNQLGIWLHKGPRCG